MKKYVRNFTEEQRIAQRARVLAWQKANPEKTKQNKKRYVDKNRERLREQARANYDYEKSHARFLARKQRDPERHQALQFWAHQRRAYGLTQEQWKALFAAQGNKCGCCERLTPGGRNRWHTDHDHHTGKVRGIVCYGCNIMFGGARDDVAVLLAGIRYLTRC